MNGEMTRGEIQERLELKNEKHFRENYQQVGVKLGLIEMTIPDKPRRDIGVFILDRKLEIKITKIEKKLNVLRLKT
jgi:hypothetical protein